ncbi:hypothetical protein [Virgisporangium aliadipatigenens]|nr:hypothetical protein [Virgisporangium aliadipatigenens]
MPSALAMIWPSRMLRAPGLVWCAVFLVLFCPLAVRGYARWE